MKKKIFALVFALLLMIPVISLNAKEKEKVKVYVFEAGGCPYCVQEIDYLQGLDSYNKKFVIEKRELYVDHVKWAKGRDYELGKAVAEKFKEDGFENASYDGTPFVVISDLYAAAAYSTDLESYINKAYKEGDKDVVDSIAKKLKVENVNRDDIGEGESSENPDTSSTSSVETYSNGEKPNVLVVIGAIVLLVGAMAFIIKTGNKNNEEDDVEVEDEEVEDDDDDEDDEEVKEVKKAKPVTKKTQTKTSTAKKTTTKKTTTKKTNTQRKTNKK